MYTKNFRWHITSLVILSACQIHTSDQTIDFDVKKEDSSVDTNLTENEQWASNYVKEMNEFVASSDHLQNINRVEDIVSEIEESIVKSWIQSWKASDLSNYLKLFAEDSRSLEWNGGTTVLKRASLGIVESTWTISDGEDGAEGYLSEFSSIEDFSLKIIHLEEISEKEVVVTLEFDLRAIQHDGMRQQDRGHLTMNCFKEDTWKITLLQSSTMERLQSQREPAFADFTESLGLTILPITDRKEAIRRGGYALVTADYDQDGMVDMLVGNSGPINLLRNTGNGFEDVTISAGLESEEMIKGAGMVDMDNDGDRDLILLRFAAAEDPRGDFVIYENNGDGTFQKHTDILPRRRAYDTPMPLSLGDYNNDGFIDIYIGFPGVRDFSAGISTQNRPDWQASQGIWFNQGNWVFVEADDDNAVITDNETYAHAAASTDLDGDGWIDLLVVDDSGRINPVYRNTGTGNFEPLGMASGLQHTGTSMGITTGDFNNDGLLDVMSSHVVMTAGHRIADSMDGVLDNDTTMGRMLEHVRDMYVDVQLFENNGNGTFTDITATSNLQWGGEAAGAGEWLDYNHDGLLDYYLPNGLWSSGEDSIDSLYFRADLIRHGLGALGIEDEGIPFNLMTDATGGATFISTERGMTSPMLKLLRNYRKQANEPLSLSFVGYQRNALFRNNGDGTFTEVGFLEGVDRIEDGYIIAPVDFDGDGLQDIVLRNTDPAKEHSFQPVIALKNQLSGNSLQVKLNSSQGNTDGLGARVTVHIGNKIISREIRSVSGAVQAEPMAYFGLGDATQVDKVVVTWPGGDTQQVLNVQKGKLVIERGQ